MRNIIFFIAIVMVALSSCSKGEKVCCDAPAAPQLPDFYVYGFKSDTAWVGKPYVSLSNRGVLYLEAKSTSESFILLIEDFKGKGSYKLAGTNCRFYNENGIDYYADLSPVNSFDVDEYDETTGILSGTLTVNMKTRMTSLPGNPDPEFYFSKGQFRLALSK
ncbi:hypothetical protein IM792_14140 [Mucilaginibacter sp. JRF]|uniref:hypothetical protein n=1 Tax=Mucilaginibacter sp. JRF TaxID=2780088 RepID=UPI001881B802|nr:hypothetical protein [Mucilaginibacter sp. JRF]MBE9585592.1 hypothetical protein [Mucilaginibacter sp. JRF]